MAVTVRSARANHQPFSGLWKFEQGHVAAVLKKIAQRYGKLHVVYEAGPCGYGLYRQINGAGHVCAVVSPAHTPRRAGDRVKTDRRDAILLARLAGAGALTSVWVPDQTHEAMRDLIRAREVAVKTVRQARQRIQGFLLRYGRRYVGAVWKRSHRIWLGNQSFEHPAQQITFQSYLNASMPWTRRSIAKSSSISRLLSSCASGRSAPWWWRCKRSVARQLIVEAAWAYRMPAKIGQAMQRRPEALPTSVRDIAWKAQVRLCTRYRRMLARRKKAPVVARELVGFIWAIACQVEPTQAAA